MSDKIVIIPQPILPAGQAPGVDRRSKTGATGPSFDEVLGKSLENSKVQFSHHARQRMASRGISFSEAELGRLDQAVNLVRSKGGRDSLVLLNDSALVVSVKNSQVVTVVDRENLKDNVFTNIDSAIIA
ncbi:MAG: TIGR02530 family flagellar biosynthesis protein [Syntrophotaleaceae bacterium]